MIRIPMARFALPALLAVPLSLAAGRPAAQAPLPQGRFTFQTYGIQEGLGNLAVLSLHQDHTGFLWAGTEDGLYR